MANSRMGIASNTTIASVVVTAQQMQAIESALFEAGMPVAALMEKVAGRAAAWIIARYPRDRAQMVGIIVGPGNNGGDALVVARELYHSGYSVLLWCPFDKSKDLPAQHRAYLDFLGIPVVQRAADLKPANLIIDGGFGLGQTREVTGDFADGIKLLNTSNIPIISIDLPSGIATDSGAVLGTAIQARYTLCLGLWKLGLLQDQAQPWIGEPHLLPFDIPIKTVDYVLQDQPALRRLTAELALACLPLPRSPIAHKYKAGHALLIAGSQEYTGAVLLTGKGAIASGVGMLTLVVPESLKMAIASQLPEALIVAAPQTEDGVIAALPDALDLAKFDVIACGPGLTRQASAVMQAVMASDRPLVLDADALNWLSENDPELSLQQRPAPTLLTPHPGEFRRLFPQIWKDASMPSAAAQAAAQTARCELILKGAMSAIAHQDGRLWLNPESTPALARGGSGDVLTGLIAGLAAQHCQHDPHDPENLLSAALTAVWWHAQTGRAIAANRTVLGCAASELANQLPQTLAKLL